MPGVDTSSPLVSFSIMTPFRVSVRFVVVVSSTWSVGATGGVVTVVEEETDDCANPTPDINVSAAVAARMVFNMTGSPEKSRASGLARRRPSRTKPNQISSRPTGKVRLAAGNSYGLYEP